MANYRFADSEPYSERSEGVGTTLTERVYGALRDEIVTGAMQPGTRLVRRALSKRLGVSPMPVTEALLRLEVDGLVENRPLYGARVRPLTIDDVRNDEVLREAIECQVARTCAENASDADFASLQIEARTIDRMMNQGDPRSKLGMQTHLSFHMSLARYGGFPRLADELERVWFRRLMRLSWVKATHCKRVPKDWHQSLLEAIASRDPDAAEAKMREHVKFGCEDDRQALSYLLSESSDGGDE
jgi:DNA-binding GntR family transcriptional regulator